MTEAAPSAKPGHRAIAAYEQMLAEWPTKYASQIAAYGKMPPAERQRAITEGLAVFRLLMVDDGINESGLVDADVPSAWRAVDEWIDRTLVGGSESLQLAAISWAAAIVASNPQSAIGLMLGPVIDAIESGDDSAGAV